MTTPDLLDCDTHFSDHEPELWAGDGPAVPEVVTHEGRRLLRIGDLLFPKPTGTGQGNPSGLGHLVGPGHDEDRAPFMAGNGIVAAVLQPGFVGLSFQAVPGPADRTGLAARYDELAARACATSALDLRWTILLSAEDPGWSLAEVERHRHDPYLVGATVRPTARTPAARLGDPAFTPVLEALAGHGLALFVHGGTGCHQWSPLADAYADYTLTHALGHMGEQMIALADLLTRRDGLPAGLRVVMLESGVGWIPPFLERLDGHVRRLDHGRAVPSAVFAEHVAVAPDPGERYAQWAVRELGTGNVVFGSDYPHRDTVRAGEWLGAFGELCPREALRDNTRRFVPRLAEAAGRGAV
jgi:predicted TIM-barrel fold metal-dependent hydrolase